MLEDRWAQRYLGLSLAAWTRIGILTVLFGMLFWPNLLRLWHKTNPFYGEANWAHAIAVPLIGLYYLYINSDDLLKRKVEALRITAFTRERMISAGSFVGVGLLLYLMATPLGGLIGGREAIVQAGGMALMVWGVLAGALNWGIGTLIFGIGLYAYGIWPGQNDYVKDVGMVVALFGLVLALCGWDVMKIAWFPIAFLICALPWPGLVYSWVAGPLQVIAARVAVEVLQTTGVEAYVAGTKIFMLGESGAWRTLNVAEACAGLRSLMTFITFGAAIAFLSARPLWQKVIITFSAIPIAIFCNTIRVAGQGLLDYYVSHELSQNFAHQFVGLIMLIPAFFLLLLVGWILDRLIIEEVDNKHQITAAPAAPMSSSVIAVPPRPATASAGRTTAARSANSGDSARTTTPPPPAGGSLRRPSGRQSPRPQE